MKRLILILLGLVVLLAACEKEEEVRYSGIVVFSSEPGGQYFTNGYGFSFEEGKNIVCQNLSCKQADIVAVHLILQTEIEAVFLQSPENNDAFFLNESFDTEAEAVSYYNDYTEVAALDFAFATSELQVHQVWTFQSTEMKYAKFRIIEISIYNDATYPFAEVTVEYKYQPGGIMTFSR